MPHFSFEFVSLFFKARSVLIALNTIPIKTLVINENAITKKRLDHKRMSALGRKHQIRHKRLLYLTIFLAFQKVVMFRLSAFM